MQIIYACMLVTWACCDCAVLSVGVWACVHVWVHAYTCVNVCIKNQCVYLSISICIKMFHIAGPTACVYAFGETKLRYSTEH